MKLRNVMKSTISSLSNWNLKSETMVLQVTDILPKATLWPQWIAGIGATLMLSTIGLLAGWSSPYLAQLTSEDSPIPITLDEASWVASLLPGGRFAGAIFGAIGVAYFGSKMTLLLCNIPVALAWILIIVSNSVEWIYAARFSGGIGMGMIFCCYPLYLGEISDPKIRGALVGMAVTGMHVGFTTAIVMGALISMVLFAWISLIPNVVCLVLFICVPESPHYLVQQDKIAEAEKSIHWYHRGANVKSEVVSLQEFVKLTNMLSIRDKIKSLGTRQNRKAFNTTVLLFSFMQLSGINNIAFYMEIILIDSKVTVVTPGILVIAISAIAIFSAWGSAYCADLVGRRGLLIWSSLGVGLGMLALGIHFMLLGYGYDPIQWQWLPITSLVVIEFFMCFGLLVIPSTILSEICAANIKSMVACVASVAAAFFAFIASKTYQPMIDALGAEYVFWAYAILMAISMVYCIIYVPETKGKSLQEIQDMLAEK